MSDKIRKFFFGRVVLEGGWTFFFRFIEIVLVGMVLIGLIQQFRG